MKVEDYQENYFTGYVSVYRSVLSDDFWVSEKFTRGQAWIDLLLLAKYKDGFFYNRGIKVDYRRGDVTEGIINLAKRWKWSRNKVQKFINDLEKEGQIGQQKSNVITLISISNYNIYQKKDNKRYNRRTTNDTTEGQQKDTHNKDNNINKENKDNNNGFSFRKSLIDLGFDKNLVDDYLKNRKLKRLANTETAFNIFINEIEKSGLDKNKLMVRIVSNGWGGFKSSWVNKENKSKKIPGIL